MKATAIRLTDTSRDFFKKMNFPEIPEAAEYIAFTEDGEACFLSELTGLKMPKLAIISYYEDIEVEV